MSVIIRLQKLPWTANAIDIRRFFYGMSIPDGGVHIIGGELGDAFIAFSTDEDARKAMQLTGSRLNDAQVTLQLSSKSEMQAVIAAARSGIVPKAADSSLPPVSSYPPVDMPPDPHGYRDPPAFGQPDHHASAIGQMTDGRIQRPIDEQAMFRNSPGMPGMPGFMRPPPLPFHRPEHEREMRGQPDRPEFSRPPMPSDGQRFGEEMDRRDVVNRGPDQHLFNRRPPERPDFDRRHGGDAIMMDVGGRHAWDRSGPYHPSKGDRAAEHGKDVFIPDTGGKPRHDVPSIGPGDKSGYGGGPRALDRNFSGLQRDISYDRIDPGKPSIPAPNRRDSPRVGNDPGPGRDPSGFMKDTARFPETPSVLDTDGRTQTRGARPEQGGEFGRQMPMNDAALSRFGRGEGMRHEDRPFDAHGREPLMPGSRLPMNQSRNAFSYGMSIPPGPGGMEEEPLDRERGRHAPGINKDVSFPAGPGHMMQGPPGSNSSKRMGLGMEFDGMSRDMPQQPGMPPREPMGFGRGRTAEPLGFGRGRAGDEIPPKDGERNMFERDMRGARSGPGFDRGGPHKDGIQPGAGTAGRVPELGRNVPPLGAEIMTGFPKGSPQAGRGRLPMTAEGGHGVGRGGPMRDLGRPDMFQDTPMPDIEMGGMGRGGPPPPQRDGGFNRGGMPRESDVPDFGRGGMPRDADMPGFGRGGPGRDNKPAFGRWGTSEDAVQSKDRVPFDIERPGFRQGGPPSDMGRQGFGRVGALMDIPGGPLRDVERPGFGRSGHPIDLDSRARDVERPGIDRGLMGADKQGFGRGGPRADVGGPGDGAPGFGRRGLRMDIDGPSGYADGPGFQRMGDDGQPIDSDQSRMGDGRPPMDMDLSGFVMGGPQQENDRHGFGQSRHDGDSDGRRFNDSRDGPQDGTRPGRPDGDQFGMHRNEPWDRARHNEPQFRRDDGQRRDEPMRLGPDRDGRQPRQNMRPPMKPGLLGDAPGDVKVNNPRGGNDNPPSIPNLFDEPLIEGWHPGVGGGGGGHPGAGDDRARRRGSGRMERDYDRREASPRSHDDELRRHDRKRSRGGGDADVCFVHVSGLPRIMNYRDIRRLFRGSDIPRDGLKVTNDRRGQRIGECFIHFFAPSHAEAALRRDGANVDGRTIRVRPCSEYDFDRAVDSYTPGTDDHGSRSSAKRPRSRSPGARQHGDSDVSDTYLAVKNLPHKATKADLKKFFGGLRLVDDSVHIENHKETSTAYVQLASRRDYPAALDLHKHTLNSRAIDIFPISAREFQSQVALLKGIEAENADDTTPKNAAKPDSEKTANGIARPAAEQQRKSTAPTKQPPTSVTHTTCVKMNGLPSSANGAMVKEFFAGLQLATRGINIIYNPDQTATGVAFVEFASAVDCEKALGKNRTSMGDSRCVSVAPIDTNEMQMQMAVEKARIRVPLPVPDEKKPAPPPLSSIPPPLGMPEQQQQPPPQQQPQQRPAFGVLIRNTPFRITEVELHAFFQCCRPIPGSVKIQRAPNGKPTGDSMIAFHNPMDARRAVAELNGRFLMGRALMLSL